MKNGLLLIIFILAISSAYAQEEHEPFTSKIYFPASIGINIPFNKAHHTQVKSGIILNTAVEFRPTYINAVFFRFDYDALTNKYKTVVRGLPTNVVEGTLSTNFLVAGAGYRRKLKRWAVYGLLQPGLGINSFERATLNPDHNIVISSVSQNNFSVKGTVGVEYYIVKHFSLTFEPSFYKIFSNKGFNSFHSIFTTFNVGINTVIF